MAGGDLQSGALRVQPRPALGLAAYLTYFVLVLGLGVAMSVDYGELSHSSENILKGIILPIGIAGVAMAAFATRLGWWRPVMRERPAPSRWALAIPIVASIGIIGGLASIDWADWDAGVLILLFVGCLLVGFGEEIATRGLLLVGLRSQLTEGWVWFTTSALFALMHAANAINGQELGQTAIQVVMTFFLGSVFYAIRRVTGLLVVGMLIHGIGDFALLAEKGPGGDAGETVAQGSPVHRAAVLISIILTLVALRRMTRGGAAMTRRPERLMAHSDHQAETER